LQKARGDFLSGYFSFWWMDYFESLFLLGGDEILQSFWRDQEELLTMLINHFCLTGIQVRWLMPLSWSKCLV